MNQHFYFQPRNFRPLAEAEGCAPRPSLKPSVQCGIGIATGIGLTAGLGVIGAGVGIGGSALSDFGGKGTTTQQDYVKNQGLQDEMTGQLRTLKGTEKADTLDLNSYIKDYLSQTPQVGQWTRQEQSAIDPFYNGAMASNLASLRTARMLAGREAVARAIADQHGMGNRSLLAGGVPGSSSYFGAEGMRLGANTDLANELANLDQSRTDLGYVTGNQINLAGRRAALADALAGRALTPINLRNNNLSWANGILNSLTGTNNANNNYSYQYQPSSSEKIGSFMSSLGGATATAGGLPGGMGGAGAKPPPSQSQMDALNVGAGPMNATAATNRSRQNIGDLNSIMTGSDFSFN